MTEAQLIHLLYSVNLVFAILFGVIVTAWYAKRPQRPQRPQREHGRAYVMVFDGSVPWIEQDTEHGDPDADPTWVWIHRPYAFDTPGPEDIIQFWDKRYAVVRVRETVGNHAPNGYVAIITKMSMEEGADELSRRN